jgi:hypothetical protein
MDKQAWLGKRVAINYGVIEGELATVVPDEDGEWWEMDGKNETVYIQFDRKDAQVGEGMRWTVLSNQWEWVENLRVVE